MFLLRLCFALFVVVSFQTGALAREVISDASSSRAVVSLAVVDLDSREGQERMARSVVKGRSSDFELLKQYFEAQINGTYCGPATAAIVLNTLADASVYTQDSVVAKGSKSKAEVLGKAVMHDGVMVRDGGYQLRQFDEMLRANGVTTRMVVADNTVSDETMTNDLIDILTRPDHYLAVNYHRSLAGQRGGGHISPIGGYDDVTDSFLLIDVNPSVARWAWIPRTLLFRAMRSLDTVENRGYVEISKTARHVPAGQ